MLGGLSGAIAGIASPSTPSNRRTDMTAIPAARLGAGLQLTNSLPHLASTNDDASTAATARKSFPCLGRSVGAFWFTSD
jgi:hypothetical protein